tara:strand:+ start:2962 stop:4284 length:1323 start_codon:yes stop_codon:yes gene_type:complete
LAWLLFGDRISSVREVEIITVITRKADNSRSLPTDPAVAPKPETDPFSGEVLFQASGWIEASPLPTRATALIDGVVDQVFVLEGESVQEGQLLATLISEDAEIEVLEAKAKLAEAETKVRQESTRQKQAEARLETHYLQVEAAEARLEELLDDEQRFRNAGKGAFSARDVAHSSLQVNTHKAQIAAIDAQRIEIETEIEAIELDVETARHQVKVSQAALLRAELALSRTKIYSPITGVVQSLYAAPGQKRMLGMDDHESATIAILYQPEKLQARIDVPLEEAALLRLDQPVRLRSNLLPNREFRGRVDRIVGMADIQRNTVQAKVIITDPDPQLRPDMLCRAEFLSASADDHLNHETNGTSRVSLYVPEAVLQNRSDNKAEIWTLDDRGETAELRSIELGATTHDNFIEVTGGLSPGDPIIISPPAGLRSGERVRNAHSD